MITPEIKIELKKYLKSDYTEDVAFILKKQGVLNRNNKPYSDSAIKNCLNGSFEQLEIEKALTVVYNQRKKAFRKHQNRLKRSVAS